MERSLLIVGKASSASQSVAALRRIATSAVWHSTLAAAVRAAMDGESNLVVLLATTSSGDEAVAVLRAVSTLPILVIAADDRLADTSIAAYLDAGADAVINGPIASVTLAARLDALCRRAEGQAWPQNHGQRVVTGDLAIDVAAHTVTVRGTEVRLSPIEFSLLRTLAQSPNQVVTNRELLSQVWGPEYVNDIHYVRLYIGYLRSKIEVDPHCPKLIVNQWGTGYRMATDHAMDC